MTFLIFLVFFGCEG